jgi:tetratricopeptide (TPR) repeat protein
VKRKLLILISLLLILILSGSAFSQELSKEEKRARKKEVRTLLKNSVKFTDDGKLDSALIMLDSLLVLDPKNPDAFYKKGWILAQQSDSVNAIIVLEEGVEKAPMSTRLRLLLVRLKIGTGDVEGAVPHLDYILKIKPNEGETLYLKGLTLLEQNDSAKAVEAFLKAMDLAFKKGSK